MCWLYDSQSLSLLSQNAAARCVSCDRNRRGKRRDDISVLSYVSHVSHSECNVEHKHGVCVTSLVFLPSAVPCFDLREGSWEGQHCGWIMGKFSAVTPVVHRCCREFRDIVIWWETSHVVDLNGCNYVQNAAGDHDRYWSILIKCNCSIVTRKTSWTFVARIYACLFY